MVGYSLANTVSPNGTVTRGVCRVENGKLTGVQETFQIRLFPDGTIRDTEKSEDGPLLVPETPVSMNFWGFTPWIFGELEAYFDAFLRALPPEELKKECLLPMLVGELIGRGELSVSVLHSDARWFGMTYREDRDTVAAALRRLHEDGTYPPTLRA